ncbi:unnamed protein product [Caenorhabditis auriculariae]|uniref:Uncharacterized protein n=1 Tax=Caenorhabditis auriculariae TaxID=2777116 RepID=A0A8S1HVM7_9PELO|nr:unnamed protein product [Caenorhabditis auriculariae]
MRVSVDLWASSKERRVIYTVDLLKEKARGYLEVNDTAQACEKTFQGCKLALMGYVKKLETTTDVKIVPEHLANPWNYRAFKKLCDILIKRTDPGLADELNNDETFEEGAASPTEAQPGELSEILEISAKDQVEIEEALIDLLHIFIILAPAVNERQIFRWWRVISEAIQCSLRDCRAALASRKSAQTVVKLPGVIRRRREAKPCPCRDFERHLAAL